MLTAEGVFLIHLTQSSMKTNTFALTTGISLRSWQGTNDDWYLGG